MVKKSENMVDKENQWDDIEYTDMQDSEEFEDFDDSEFNDEAIADSDEHTSNEQDYSEHDYDEDDEFDDFSEPSNTGTKKKNLFPILLVVLILIGGLVLFLILGLSKKNNAPQVVNDTNVNMEQPTSGDLSAQGQSFSEDDFFGDGSTEMVGMNFDENGSASQTTAISENQNGAQVNNSAEGMNTVSFETPNTANQNAEQSVAFENNSGKSDLFQQSDEPLDVNTSMSENNDIIISYDKVARVNPFKPPVKVREKEIEKTIERLNNTDFEIVEPPMASVPDANLTRLLQSQVSGILYDDESPSAIVNLNGIDTFVKVGDTLSGYKIQAITKDKVQIYYKNNSYVAAVGALFVRGMLESRPAVANLEKKFAGRYKDNN